LVQIAALTAILWVAAVMPAASERLMDLVQVEGARDNQLIGYGLVAGLAGTGDQTTQVPYSVQSIQNMLRQLGLTLNPNAFIQPTAVASVIVTAELPTFMPIGQKLDVTVSALGNAKSLRGGVLLMTELRGADGQVYAIAQGSLLVSGYEASGQAASTTVNIPTVAHIPRGATIEKTPKAGFAAADTILLDLDNGHLAMRPGSPKPSIHGLDTLPAPWGRARLGFGGLRQGAHASNLSRKSWTFRLSRRNRAPRWPSMRRAVP
jgi:flagellar P-ring protein precursor FlgI